MRWLAIVCIFVYRWTVRPFLRRRCLYPESCSAFAIRELRELGVAAALPRIRARIRSCRLPASACFVVDEHGRARLISASGHDGLAPPPLALEILACEAEKCAHGSALGDD